MSTRPKEVANLARLLFDRTEGHGAFEALSTLAQAPQAPRDPTVEGPSGHRVVEGIVSQAHHLAEQAIRDVFMAIPDLTVPATASTWLARVYGNRQPSGWTVESLADHALAVMVQHASRTPMNGALVIPASPADEVLRVQTLPAASLADGVRLLEAWARKPEYEACSVCLVMDMRPDAAGKAMGHVAGLFGTVTAPMVLFVCLLGLQDGTRATVLAPYDERMQDRKILSYCDEGPISEAYAVRGGDKSEGAGPTSDKTWELADYAIGHLAHLSESWEKPFAISFSIPGTGATTLSLTGSKGAENLPVVTIPEAIGIVHRACEQEGIQGFAMAVPLRLKAETGPKFRERIRSFFGGMGPPELLLVSVSLWEDGCMRVLARPSYDGLSQKTLTSIEMDLIKVAYEPAR